MDKRVIGFAVLAVLIGFAVMFLQAILVGVFASQAGPMPHDITLAQLEWYGLWHSAVFTWGLPSALGALLIACIKPRRWGLYSFCAILPYLGQLLAITLTAVDYDIHIGYMLLTGLLNLAMMPLFLGLYYLLIRRHATA